MHPKVWWEFQYLQLLDNLARGYEDVFQISYYKQYVDFIWNEAQVPDWYGQKKYVKRKLTVFKETAIILPYFIVFMGVVITSVNRPCTIFIKCLFLHSRESRKMRIWIGAFCSLMSWTEILLMRASILWMALLFENHVIFLRPRFSSSIFLDILGPSFLSSSLILAENFWCEGRGGTSDVRVMMI